MQGMIIEAAGDADMAHLCALFNSARASNGSFPGRAYALDAFANAIEGECLLVGRIAGEIAGFASVWVPDAFVHHLYVAPRFQRQGVGRALLDHCVSRFGLPMSLKCLAANSTACRFYERQGWQIVERADGDEGPYFLYVSDTGAS